ncbi:MAG: flagellar biosynthetic protein FliO [Chlamydiae bacterium]|nr:flagellar biosynthetic protein FliO [Chlamydiota bacterium]
MKRTLPTLLAICTLLTLPLALRAESSPSKEQQSILSPLPAAQMASTNAPNAPKAPEAPESLHVPMPDEIQMPTYEGAFLKMILTLVGLVALVFISVWLLKKLTQGKIGSFGKKHINIIERKPLSPKTILYIIDVDGKQILVAESQLEIKTLATLDHFSEGNS